MADLVGRLADKSLLVHRHGGERWSQLETVRAYALDNPALPRRVAAAPPACGRVRRRRRRSGA
jgi:hypothetical protein